MIKSANELCLNELKGRCRALCIDYGDKRIGVAISDINWEIASPLIVLESHGVYPAAFLRLHVEQGMAQNPVRVQHCVDVPLRGDVFQRLHGMAAEAGPVYFFQIPDFQQAHGLILPFV